MNELLKIELDKLWYGIIQKVDFNILTHKISFIFTIQSDHTKINTYNLIFHNVSSFYFIENTNEYRFNLINLENYKEFTSIGFYPKGIGKISINESINEEKEWVQYWKASPNFAIELDPGALFIEAESIQINDKLYNVGYPKID